MRLDDALAQISEIREHMARTGFFRGYRAITIAWTGLLGFAAAGIQILIVPFPEVDTTSYLVVWIGCAAVGLAIVGTELMSRCRNSGSRRVHDMTWAAIEQFLPALVAGGLLTLVISLSLPESIWMLPGLWQILFSLGVFASSRFLPRATYWVGVFYLITGVSCLALVQGDAAFSPWIMAVPFGVGQFLTAGVLYWTLERDYGEA